MGGYERMTFGYLGLVDGISFIIIAIGIFAVAEVLENIEKNLEAGVKGISLRNVFPNIQQMKVCIPVWIKSPVVGFLVGVLPGAGIAIASFLGYAFSKKTSKKPERFGTGVPEGVAASESANTAAVGGSLLPLLTLGVPGSGSCAIMLGALIMYGMRPGPLLFAHNPDLIWGIIVSMLIASVLLLIINLPLVPQLARVLMLPYNLLYPAILLLIITGAYSLRNNVFDVFMALAFGVIGYLMKKYGFSKPPLMLAVVLGPIAEVALRQSLNISGGSLMIFFNRPISAVLLILSIIFILSPVFSIIFKRWGGVKS